MEMIASKVTENIARAHQQVFDYDATDEDDDESVISKHAEKAKDVDSASDTADGVPV